MSEKDPKDSKKDDNKIRIKRTHRRNLDDNVSNESDRPSKISRFRPIPPIKIIKILGSQIDTLADLIKLGQSYDINATYDVTFMKNLHDVTPSLIKLNNLVGMDGVKKAIVPQVMYYLQKLHLRDPVKTPELAVESDSDDFASFRRYKNNRFTKSTDSLNSDDAGASTMVKLLKLLIEKKTECDKPDAEPEEKLAIDEGEFMHTVITGNRGTGKSSLAPIIGEIYAKLGFLANGKVHRFRRDELIGRFIGQTAKNTTAAIKSSFGGVFLLDEAYSLGGSERNIDTFSIECINTINQLLSEYRDKFACIIVGYEKSLNDCFFRVNEGLERRFSWRYHIDGYQSNELQKIFVSTVEKNGWKLEDSIQLDTLFDNNKSHLEDAGGACELLFTKCKISHSKRIFCKVNTNHKVLILQDINDGFELYKLHLNKKEKVHVHNSMYN